jgi:hypothetical protein
MKRRYIVFTVVFAVSMLIGMQVGEVVDANPFSFNKIIDPIQGTIPPNISISNLRNQSTCSDVINVNLHVDKAKLNSSWTSITSVSYTLDSNEKAEIYYCRETRGVQEYDTTINLFFLSGGNHTLTIQAYGVVMPKGESLSSDMFLISNSSTVNFTVGNQMFLITIIVLIIATTAVLSFFLVYYRRRKGKP